MHFGIFRTQIQHPTSNIYYYSALIIMKPMSDS